MLTESQKHSRGKALEEAFFFRMDQELITKLGSVLLRDEKIKAFEHATGIRDKKRLENLVNAGFELSTITAFIWVPLVFVAWADGNLDDLEKQAILDVLRNKGVSTQTASIMIEHSWFRHPPTEELWKTWEEFTIASMKGLHPLVRHELIDEIVGLCHVVAHASGGFLGVGKISPKETDVIDRVIGVLHPYSDD